MEVTLFVENVVIGEESLRRDRHGIAVGENGDGVGDVGGAIPRTLDGAVATVAHRGQRQTPLVSPQRNTNERHRRTRLTRHLSQHLGRGGDEAFLQQEILGRVARQG